MKLFTLLASLLFSINLFCQAEQSDCFEQISSRWLQNAIEYRDVIHRQNSRLGGQDIVTFFLNPDAIGFKTNEVLDSTFIDVDGVWYFEWYQSETKNSWQKFDTDCRLPSVVVTHPHKRYIAADIFYQNVNYAPPIKSNYEGSIILDTWFNRVAHHTKELKE